MSIYSTEFEVKRDKYTAYGQSISGLLNHILFTCDNKYSIDKIVLNPQNIESIFYDLVYVPKHIGMVRREYITSNFEYTYLVTVIIDSSIVVLFDQYDVIAVDRDLFYDMITELKTKIELYNSKYYEVIKK